MSALSVYPARMLLTKTTELAIQSLVYIARQPPGTLVNPQDIAEPLGESTAYLAKVLRSVARAGILKSRRGIAGGFELIQDPAEVTLLRVVETCQGTIPGNYCKEVSRKHLRITCGYHQAMHELQQSVREVLGRWTIGDLLAAPLSSPRTAPECRLNLLRKRPKPHPAS